MLGHPPDTTDDSQEDQVAAQEHPTMYSLYHDAVYHKVKKIIFRVVQWISLWTVNHEVQGLNPCSSTNVL